MSAEIQEKLAQARQLLVEAGKLAEDQGITHLEFMGLVFESSYGWFHGEELEEASDWNHSDCVIGSNWVRYGSVNPEDWVSSSSCSW